MQITIEKKHSGLLKYQHTHGLHPDMLQRCNSLLSIVSVRDLLNHWHMLKSCTKGSMHCCTGYIDRFGSGELCTGVLESWLDCIVQ